MEITVLWHHYKKRQLSVALVYSIYHLFIVYFYYFYYYFYYYITIFTSLLIYLCFYCTIYFAAAMLPHHGMNKCLPSNWLTCCVPPESDGRHLPEREAAFLSDTEDDLTDFQKTIKHSEVYSATVPSIDSAMSSWDSSGFDAGYSSQGEALSDKEWPISCVAHNEDGGISFSGTYLHKASDILLNPSDWRRSKHRSQTSSSAAGLVHHQSALYDGRFTEDEWDKIPGYVHTPTVSFPSASPFMSMQCWVFLVSW